MTTGPDMLPTQILSDSPAVEMDEVIKGRVAANESSNLLSSYGSTVVGEEPVKSHSNIEMGVRSRKKA